MLVSDLIADAKDRMRELVPSRAATWDDFKPALPLSRVVKPVEAGQGESCRRLQNLPDERPDHDEPIDPASVAALAAKVDEVLLLVKLLMQRPVRQVKSKDEPPPDWLTIRQVARKLTMSTRTVWRWSHEGQFPKPVRSGENGRTVRWKREEVDAWIARHQ